MDGEDVLRRRLDDGTGLVQFLAVHEALEELENEDPLKSQIVLLRYFSGMTTDETAEVLGLSASTLDRKWRYIRAWLLDRLG